MQTAATFGGMTKGCFTGRAVEGNVLKTPIRGHSIHYRPPRKTYIGQMAQAVRGLEPALTDRVAEIEQKTGRSNFLRVMAHRPEAMNDFWRFYGTLMGPGAVDRRLKEMLYLAVSSINECSYCSEHHLQTARKAGLTDLEIHEIQTEQNQHFSPQEQAALHYARELTRSAAVDSELRHRVEESFSPDQIVEMTMVIGLANFTNRFNNGLGVPLESNA